MSKLPNNAFANSNRLLKRNKVSPPGKTGGGTLPSPRLPRKEPARKTWRSERIKKSRLMFFDGIEFVNLRPRFTFYDHRDAPISRLARPKLPEDSEGKSIERISFQANNLLHRPTTLKPGDQSKSIKESEVRKIPRSLIGWRNHSGQGVATITDERQEK